MDQTGPRLTFSKAEQAAAVTVGGGFTFPLPPHPNLKMVDSHGRRTRVLTTAACDVTTELMSLPEHPDPLCVYHGRGACLDVEDPFVRTVWFSNHGEHMSEYVRNVAELEGKWRQETLRSAGVGGGGRGTQPASGVYRELGTGVLPGKGRKGVSVNGRSHFMPFSRNAEMSDVLEAGLAEVCAVAAQKALEVLPVHERDLVCCDDGPAEMVGAYQYPRQLTGRPCVCSHQVVIRGADLHAADTAAQREQAWLECVSDLHTDSMDGSMGPLGCMTQYICTQHPHAQTRSPCHSFSYRDLVVYPNACGGRGVRIRVARPGWTCLVFMRTRDCLHGGVTPSTDDTRGPVGLPDSVTLMRVVTYPLAAVQRLLLAAVDDAASTAVVFDGSDERMRARMCATIDLL